MSDHKPSVRSLASSRIFGRRKTIDNIASFFEREKICRVTYHKNTDYNEV